VNCLKQILNEHAPLLPVPCVPELVVPICKNLTQIWEATEAATSIELKHAPFWATPWPGGIALARWILDHPERFTGRCVLDLGSGSGVSGIAAARAGARVVLNDVDTLALFVAQIAARANRVSVDCLCVDLHHTELERYDVILVGDGFYERARSARLVRSLESCVKRGSTVVAADAGRNIVDLPGRRVLQIEVPVREDIEGRNTRLASVHLLEP
jgi:predicted nicotinamide N-methyase